MVIGFFDRHRWLLSDPRFSREARAQLVLHRQSLARTRRRLAGLRTRRRARLHLARTPRVAICTEFGRRYCRDAVFVARCESGLHVDARNGQYLGLFQMGALPRQLYGHGPTARAQARAAHLYFVASGRDWSPWSCKPG